MRYRRLLIDVKLYCSHSDQAWKLLREYLREYETISTVYHKVVAVKLLANSTTLPDWFIASYQACYPSIEIIVLLREPSQNGWNATIYNLVTILCAMFLLWFLAESVSAVTMFVSCSYSRCARSRVVFVSHSYLRRVRVALIVALVFALVVASRSYSRCTRIYVMFVSCSQSCCACVCARVCTRVRVALIFASCLYSCRARICFVVVFDLLLIYWWYMYTYIWSVRTWVSYWEYTCSTTW